MNVIKQLSAKAAAKLRYDIPQDGYFLAMWEFCGEPYSATYRYQDRGGEKHLQVYVDGHGYCDAGCGAADDFYSYGDLMLMAQDHDSMKGTKLIAAVVIERE